MLNVAKSCWYLECGDVFVHILYDAYKLWAIVWVSRHSDIIITIIKSLYGCTKTQNDVTVMNIRNHLGVFVEHISANDV